MSSICNSLYADRARQHSSFALRQQISQIRMAAMKYMIRILTILCYPFIFSELPHHPTTTNQYHTGHYNRAKQNYKRRVISQWLKIQIFYQISQVLILEYSMNTLKHSQFKKQNRVKIQFPEERSSYKQNGKQSNNVDKNENKQGNRWVNHLQDRPLLQLMNEQMDRDEFTPIKPTQLNCYQRLKTLLSVQSGGKLNYDKCESNSKLLKNVVIFETQINRLEQNYREVQKAKRNEEKNGRSYICSKSFTKNSTGTEKSQSNLNSTLKESIKNNVNYRYSLKCQNPKNDRIKKLVKQEIEDFKKQTFAKFMDHKRAINDKAHQQVEEMIDGKLEKKIEEVANRKIVQYQQMKEQNNKFNTILLEKELHIEHLLKQLKIKEDRIVYQIQKQQPQQRLITLRLSVQQFYDEYHVLFGNISLLQLKKKIEFMENMCLDKYSSVQSQRLEAYSQLKCHKLSLQEKLREKERQCNQKDEQIAAIINKRDKYQKFDNSFEKHQIFNRIPEFKIKMEQLEKLQKYILNKYIEWIDSKSASQTKVIKTISNPASMSKYQEMIQDMLYFNREIGSNQKQIAFIAKLLCGILKIKKIIAPHKLGEKFQALKCLDEIEVYLRNSKCKRMVSKKKTFKTKTELVIENLDQMLNE